MITKPMVYPIRFWAVVLAALLALYFSSEAIADSCKYEKDIDLELDLSSSDALAVSAGAGSLEITGDPGASKAVIHGRACASREEWLEASSIRTKGGSRAEIAVELPQSNGSWFSWGNNYAHIDLVLEVPASLKLEVSDSSGSMWLENVGAVDIRDSSGGIEINGAGGAVTIDD
ncbi:MAG: toast rack family protein, partial [Lysobacterales bacterium]